MEDGRVVRYVPHERSHQKIGNDGHARAADEDALPG